MTGANMRIELEISNSYSDLINENVLGHLANLCEVALQEVRRQRVASHTVAPTSRMSIPWQPKPGHGDENSPGVIDVAVQARFKSERDAKLK